MRLHVVVVVVFVVVIVVAAYKKGDDEDAGASVRLQARRSQISCSRWAMRINAITHRPRMEGEEMTTMTRDEKCAKSAQKRAHGDREVMAKSAQRDDDDDEMRQRCALWCHRDGANDHQ